MVVSFFGTPQNIYAQQKVNYDSLKQERQRILDSTRTAQKRMLDSARLARTRYNDSIKAVRKTIADSLKNIRAYRESKHYKDSVSTARQRRLDSIKSARKAFNDSVKQERKRVLDSTKAVQRARMDSIRLVQKLRADSLGAIRAYRQSKRYKDSVAITRQQRLDSIRVARQAYNDSVKTVRKQALDSAVAARKHINDSLTTMRMAKLDSMNTVRKARTDSLAKVRAAREKKRKVEEKKKEEKMQLALELKIKKKHEAWNNEKMLKKKWSLPRKVIQNTFTRYNYYFNADKKMEEALLNMQRMQKENYDSLLALFPFDPDRDSTLLKPDMDSIIQKTSLGIQIHDPRTKWADDLYLLLGQAYYYEGNYEDATAAFRYIISMNQQRKAKEQRDAKRNNKKTDKETSIVEKEENKTFDFLKHQSVNNDAVLWLARTYTEAHRENDAEAILDLLDNDKNLTDHLKGKVALEKAYLNLGKENYRDASPQLALVADDDVLPYWIRRRAAYLNGQLLNQMGDAASATVQFQKVVDLNPDLEMDFYARKNLAYNQLESGSSADEAMAGLKKLLKDGKYAPYYEQVYYILGRLAANNNQFDDAIGYLKKSIGSPKSTKKQKALSFSSLGNVYYSTGDYKNAKLSYDSASYLARYATHDTMVAIAVKRAGTLDKVSYPSQVIREQDSLLALAQMSEKEQKAVIRKYIRGLEQARTDSIANAENGTGPSNITDANDIGNASASWYFSNPTLMQQGLNDFKRKWGTRQNTDDWRRSAKSGAPAVAENPTAQPDDEELTGFDENGIPTELSLLAMIPSSPQQKDAANAKLQRAYLDLGNAYINNLNDYPNAMHTLDTFSKRFPNSKNKAEWMYLEYQLALKRNDLRLAQTYSEQLRREYPESKWARLVGPVEQNTTLIASAAPIATYYDETYDIMMNRDYDHLLLRAKNGQKQYKDPVYKNRFQIMEAIALAGSGSYDEADTLITQFITTHPNDSLKLWASVVSKYIKRTRLAAPAQPAGIDSANSLPVNILTNPNGTVNPARNDSSVTITSANNSNNSATIPVSYTYESKAPHSFIFYFYKMESKAMGVKAGLNDFNTFNYSNQGLQNSLEMLQPDQGLIIVKSFPNAAAAKIYMNAVNNNKLLLKEYKNNEYQTLIISNDNLNRLSAEKNITSYLNFYKKNYK